MVTFQEYFDAWFEKLTPEQKEKWKFTDNACMTCAQEMVRKQVLEQYRKMVAGN